MKYVRDARGVRELLEQVDAYHQTHSTPLVLGVDCEGLSKDRPLALIQVCVDNEVYIIDLFEVNPFVYGLKEVMESQYIIKVFHDFCEDASAIVNQYGVYCERVFDSQIAHRMLTKLATPKGGKIDYSQNNIGLNELLRRYLNKTNECKDLIQSEMKSDKLFWEKRPLTEDMLDYAAKDVLFLPFLYNAFCYVLDQYNKSCNSPININSHLDDIFTQAQKCNEYAEINRSVKELEKGDVIHAFIKNIQSFGVYCSLNIGMTGFITHKKSKNYIFEHHKIGDIVEVAVEALLKKKNKVLLRLVDFYENTDHGEYVQESYDQYYDDFTMKETQYFDGDSQGYDFIEEYQDPTYMENFHDNMSTESPMGLATSESYDMLPNPSEVPLYHPDPKLYSSMQHYAPPGLGYQPYQSEVMNTASTAYSFHHSRKCLLDLITPNKTLLESKFN